MTDKAKYQLNQVQKDLRAAREDVAYLKGRMESMCHSNDKNTGMCNALWFFMKESQRTGHVATYSQRPTSF